MASQVQDREETIIHRQDSKTAEATPAAEKQPTEPPAPVIETRKEETHKVETRKEKLVGADASHAWVSVYCPGAGWLDVDPTNNVVPSEGHVTLAWGRDYGDVSPVRGVILGGRDHKLKVAVDMVPLD